MYVGRRHIATVKVQQVLGFTCKHCAYKSDALVQATGRGNASSPFFLDETGAPERALERAEEDARESLLQTLALATCPKCGRRDDAAHAWSIFKAGVASTFSGGLAFVIGWFVPLSVKLDVALALVVAVGVFLLLRRTRLSADKRVLFPAVPARPKVSLPAAALPTSPARVPEQDPYRAPPSAPVQPVQTAKPPAPAPVVAGDPDDKPTFLK